MATASQDLAAGHYLAKFEGSEWVHIVRDGRSLCGNVFSHGPKMWRRWDTAAEVPEGLGLCKRCDERHVSGVFMSQTELQAEIREELGEEPRTGPLRKAELAEVLRALRGGAV